MTTHKTRLAIVVGSNRCDSINRKLAEALVRLDAGRFDTGFVRIDDLPMYNQDQEQPLPPAVDRFKRAIESADALLFVTPEHSRSIPAVLKNAIDWGARPWGKSSWPDKPAAIIGASGGAISTAVAQQHLRTVLGNQGLHVLGGEAYINFKPDLVDTEANVTDDSVRTFLKAFVDRLAAFADRFAAQRAAAA